MKILLVGEATPHNGSSSGLVPLLQESGIRVVRASLLTEAVALLAKDPFDIVLLVLDLPDSQGIKTLSSLRIRAPEIPVIILTPADQEPVAEEALHEGAQDFLVMEEINPRYLLRTLRYAIERNQFDQNVRRSHGHLEMAVADRSIQLEETNIALAKENEVRKRRERELRQTNRLLRVLTECNQALDHAKNERELLTWICEVMVFTGKYPAAWIGIVDEERGSRLVPLADAGFGNGFASSEMVLADTEVGDGPGRMAIASGKAFLIQNIRKDRRFARLDAESRAMGYGSAIGLPILRDESRTPGGSLVLLSRSAASFSPEERKILGQLSDDISFGIRTMRTREARQAAEEALHDSEMFYRTLINTLPVGITVVDTDEQVAFLSPKSREMLCLPADEEGLGTPFQRWLAHGPGDHAAKNRREILKGKSAGVPVESCIQKYNGATFWAELRSAILHDTSEEVIGTLVVTQDITERKQAEERLQKAYGELEEKVKERTADLSLANRELNVEMTRRELLMSALRDSELSLRSRQRLLDAAEKLAHIGSWEWDITSDICRWSDEHYRIFGYEPHAIKPTHRLFLSSIPDGDRGKVVDAEQASLATGQMFDMVFRITRSDGATRFIHIHGEVKRGAEGRPVALGGSAQDITERKKAEEELTRLATIVAQSDDAIIGLNPDGTVFSWNSGAEHTFGYQGPEAVGQDVIAFVSPRKNTKIRHNLDLIAAGEKVRPFESLCRKKDGSHFYALLTISPVRDESGEMFGLIIIARDINDRKKIQTALKESEQKYRTLFETIGQAVLTTDPRGNIVDTNPAADRILGRTHKELVGTGVTHPALRLVRADGTGLKPEALPWIRAIHEGREVRDLIGLVSSDGRHRWVVADAKPDYRAGEHSPHRASVMLTDITGLNITPDDTR